MNLDINKLITKSLPFIIMLLFTFFIAKVFYIFLPKQSVEYTKNTLNTLEYKRYILSNTNIDENKLVPIKTIRKEYVLNENIILQSIFQLGEKESFAIILEKGKTKTYTISKNETFKGYKLIGIKADYILFKKNGKIYKLFIKSYTPNKKNNTILKKQNVKANIIKRGDTSFQVSKDDVLSYSKNLKEIWNDIGLKTEKKGGKPIGFKIYKLAKKSVFDELGLKKGDILIEANNMKLDNYQNAFKLYNKINSTQLLKMTILRGNKKMEIEYEIQ